uniref:UPF0301 protein Plut_0637 isoform X2 n=1 Tax=Rhizophora mucronata TaxID=61149 RepID=A0A2P2JAD8_RHIMU
MEACFLTSNSFIRVSEFVPSSIKGPVLAYPKRNFTQFHPRRSSLPSPIIRKSPSATGSSSLTFYFLSLVQSFVLFYVILGSLIVYLVRGCSQLLG